MQSKALQTDSIIPFNTCIFLLSQMRREKRKDEKNAYYRLLDSGLPSIGRYAATPQPQSPEKQAERILRSQQYLYIDMENQSGCRAMERIEYPEDENEEVEKLGNSYISNLKYLSERSQQTIDYLQRSKDLMEQKESIRKVVQKQIQSSLKRAAKKKNYRVDYDSLKKNRTLEYDPMRLKQMIEEEALEVMNQSVWNKERRLIDKFGIMSNYVSTSHAHQQSLLKSRKLGGKKFQLPTLPLHTLK